MNIIKTYFHWWKMEARYMMSHDPETPLLMMEIVVLFFIACGITNLLKA